jgi:uncharacterized protein (TIGR00299 family) protein
MFVAALCAARPDLEPALQEALAGAGLPEGVRARLVPDRRGGLAGTRFLVEIGRPAPASGELRAILARLEAAALAAPVRRRAAALYRRLGEAEAAVHGVPLERVHFHEIADWDTWADIVAAAALIEALGEFRWSCAPLPLGSGLVATAHGLLPVPAPATLRLLGDLPVHDDGLPGERVTPTGAAILAELAPAARLPDRPLRLLAAGHGLGARELPGRPNLLRALVLAEAAPECAGDERIAVLRFEIDDQPAEDLALGLERLRARADVLDLCQWAVVGKRGRLASAVQVLCPAAAADAVAEACLAETATLGVRIALARRRRLARESLAVEAEGLAVRVKRARRPDGAPTAKAELADLAASGLDLAGRSRLRRRAEERALEEDGS